MKLGDLLIEINRADITLNVEGDTLNIVGEKKSISNELLKKIKMSKEQIITHLTIDDRESHETLKNIYADDDRSKDIYPFADMQVGFYVADNEHMDYQVRPHFYLESDRTLESIDRYKNAWNKALNRHKKSLSITHNEGMLQPLEDDIRVKIIINDLVELSTEETDYQLMATRKRLAREQLPLDQWPWFTLEVSRWQEISGIKHRIHFNSNNFFWDGFSIKQLFSEVDQHLDNPNLSLEPLTISFRDVVLALRDLETSILGVRSKNYWLSRIETFPAPPTPPLLVAKNRKVRSHLLRRTIQLTPPQWKKLKKNSALYGIMPSTVIFTIYAEVLSAWSNREHFLLANMVSQRFSEMHQEINELVGNFSTVYPLEVDFRGCNTFVERAQRIQQQLEKDSQYIFYGGMKVMQELNRVKGEIGNSPCPFVIGSGLSMGKFENYNYSSLETCQVLLDHTFWELNDGTLNLAWDIFEEFFPEGVVDDMWQAYITLLMSLATDKHDWQNSSLKVLPDQSLAQRTKVNQTKIDLPLKPLPTFLQQAAIDHPQRVAVECSGERYSYQQLWMKSQTIAHHLHSMINRGEAIAIMIDRGPALLAATYATLITGAFYIPIDPNLPIERKQLLLKNSGAKLLLVSDEETLSIAPLYGNIISEIVNIDSLDSAADNKKTIAINAKITELAYVIYTSGSTGNPKGVMIDHRGASNTVLDINRKFTVTSDDVIFGVSSFSFDLSVYDIFGAAEVGAKLVYPRSDLSLNPGHWLELLIEHQVTLWNSVPALVGLLVDTAMRQQLTLDNLRLIMMSGDWIPTDLPEKIRTIAPNAEIISLGGATEASIWSIYYPITTEKTNHCTSIPYGFPLANQYWHIRDSRGRHTPKLTGGDLYIGGIGLAQGYYQDPEKTDGSFIVDSNTGKRLYRTGDQGRYLHDGSIEFLGRNDFQVKIQGYRVELGEIESQLLSHQKVSNAIVTAQKDNDSTLQRLVAYIIPTPAASDLSTNDLVAWLKLCLPSYMIPNHWLFLERLPLTSNGKIDRKSLPLVDTISANTQTTLSHYVAPQNAMEHQLVSIWLEVLEQDKIGTHDDFFDIGGQSFSAVRIVAMIKETLGIMISLQTILETRTIARLAAALATTVDKKAATTLTVINNQSTGRPLFLVHPAGGYTFCYRELGQLCQVPTYGFQAVGVDGHDIALDNITDMANRYMNDLLTTDVKDSLNLGGWSSGGLISFALAQQLEERNYTVKELVIIDCPAPPFRNIQLTEKKLLHWFFEDLGLGIPSSVLTDEIWYENGDSDQLKKALSLVSECVDVPFGIDFLLPVYRVFKGIVIGSHHYKPKIINANITLLRATKGKVSEFKDHPKSALPCWGWSELTTGQVNHENIDGSHHTLLVEPAIQRCAEVINNRLQYS